MMICRMCTLIYILQILYMIWHYCQMAVGGGTRSPAAQEGLLDNMVSPATWRCRNVQRSIHCFPLDSTYIYNHMYVKVYQCTVYLCICMCILLFLVHSTLISLLFPCDLPCFPFILSSTPFLFPLSPLACPIDSHLISNLFPSDSQAIFGLLFATAGHRNRQKRIGKRNIIRIIRRVVGST